MENNNDKKSDSDSDSEGSESEDEEGIKRMRNFVPPPGAFDNMHSIELNDDDEDDFDDDDDEDAQLVKKRNEIKMLAEQELEETEEGEDYVGIPEHIMNSGVRFEEITQEDGEEDV